MIEHTPGPWRVDTDKSGLRYGVTGPKRGRWHRRIALCGSHPPDFSLEETRRENQANAHLIAAAPKMLAALKEVLAAQSAGEISYRSTDGRGYEAMLAVEAAIAKAEGRPS